MALIRKYIRALLESNVTLCPFPKAMFMAGGPGSGKSTVIKKLGLRKKLQVINPDDAFEAALVAAGLPLDRSTVVDNYRIVKKKYLQAEEAGDTELAAELEPEYLALRAIMSQSMKLFSAARSAAKKTQHEYVCDKQSFLVDGTAGDARQISKQVRELRDLGYDVAMVFVDVPLQTSIDRNIARGKAGDRRLHDDTVVRSWSAVDKNKDVYSNLFGRNFFLVDATEESFHKSIDEIAPAVQAFLSEE